MSYLFSDMAPEIKAEPVPEIIARPYQVEAIDAAFREWQTVPSTLIVLPTGTGKSVVFAKILKRWLEGPHFGRVMILAHRKELIAQAKEHAISAGATCEIEMASQVASAKCDVVAASVQTLNAGRLCFACEGVNSGDCVTCGGSGRVKRMTRFDPRDFGLVITDEGHHCHIPGTMVETTMGQQPIESLELGQKVVSWNGTTARTRRIEDKFRYCYDGPVIELSTRDGSVTVTPNHQMYSNGKRIHAKDIAPGDSISVPDLSTRDHKPIRSADALSMEAPGNEALPGMSRGNAGQRAQCTQECTQARAYQVCSMRGYDSSQGDGRTHDGAQRHELHEGSGTTRKGHGETFAESGVLQKDCETDDGSEPHGGSGDSSESISVDLKTDRSGQCCGVWQPSEIWERKRDDAGGITDVGALPGCGVQFGRDHGGRDAAISLQARLSVAGAQGGPRVRRNITRRPEGIGQSEGSATDSDWMDHSQSSELRSWIRESRVTSVKVRHYSGYVYDIEVADDHNYIANGLLSSNSTAASYMDVYTWFGSNVDNRRLFVTATPERADGQGLHNVCESVAYEMGLRTAIDEGWLCPIRQQFIEVAGLDLSRVSTRQGDLADGELERAFIGEDDEQQEKLLHAVAKPVLETAGDQQFIVFASGVKHAELLLAAFNAYDARVELILGNTDAFERQRIVERLKTGVTQGLVNVGVATEGFDCPAVAVVAIARPTKSTSLYLQMIGRGTRPLPGVVDGPETAEDRRKAIAGSSKTHCSVMDFVGNSGTHKLVSVVDVLAGEHVDSRDIDEAIRLAKREATEPADMEELLDKAKTAREAKEREAEEKRRMSTHRKADRVDMTAVDVDLFGGSSFDAFRDYEPEHPNAATVKQVNYLTKCLGISPAKATSVTKRQAGAMIDALTRKTGGDYIVTFGKHKGQPIKDVPSGWLNWAVREPGMREDLVRNIQQYRRGE